MEQDLIHRRPFLFASLAFGLSYPLASYIYMPEMIAILWKMAAVGCLALYALRNHSHGHFAILASFLLFYSLGDGLIEFELIYGAIAFAIGHFIAIYLFLQNRRTSLNFSQKLLALFLPIITPLIAWTIISSPEQSGYDVAIYSFIIALMAAFAWTSSFPRYRVGLGAISFIISDLLIFQRMNMLSDIIWLNLLIWYGYYFGVFLMATGIVQTLRKKGT